MITVFKREFCAFFYTPSGYVFAGVFLLLSGVCFGIANLSQLSCNMLIPLSFMNYIWMLICPVAVMRLLAGERMHRTDKLLYSAPISMAQVVIAKYFAALALMLITVALTLVYPLILAIWGTLYFAETAVAYLGLILQGAAIIALDMLVSCFTRSQVTCTAACIGVNLFLWLADLISSASGTVVQKLLSFVSLYSRYEPFSNGILNFANILFYLIFTAVCLFICTRVMDSRRWSGI